MGYATGSEKRTEMVATHMTATHPTTFPYLPRLNGPATKVLRDSVTLKKIGNAYAMYSPMVAIDTIAWNATILPSDCQFISHHITSHIQTQRGGREKRAYGEGHTERYGSREPNRVNRNLSAVHFVPQGRKWHCSISRKRIRHPDHIPYTYDQNPLSLKTKHKDIHT